MAYVRIIEKKTRDRSYLYAYLVESFWNPQKRYPDHRVIRSFGAVSPQEAQRLRFAFNSDVSVSRLNEIADMQLGETWPVGDVYLGHLVWEKWGLGEMISQAASAKFDVPAADMLEIMVLNRLVEPRTEFALQDWYGKLTGLRYLTRIDPQQLYYRRLYRYTREMDRIFPGLCIEIKKKLQKLVHQNKKIDIAYYDITSTFFQSANFCLIAAYGYSRDHREDKKQVVPALICDRYGFPFHAQVLPGNTADKATVPQMVEKMKNEFGLGDCIVVGDRGMISRDNFKTIEDARMGYLMALTRDHIAADLGEYPPAIAAMRDKQTLVFPKDGNFYIVRFNQEKKEEEAATRARRLERVSNAMSAIQKSVARGKAKTVADVAVRIGRIHERYTCERFLRWYYDEKKRSLSFSIDGEAVSADAALDGLLVLKTNREKPATAQSVEVYKGLADVERAFKTLKSILKMRPIHHHHDPYVRGHIYICVLACLLERYIGLILEKNGVKTRPATILKTLSRIEIGDIVSNDGRLLKRSMTAFPQEQAAILSFFGASRQRMIREITGGKPEGN